MSLSSPRGCIESVRPLRHGDAFLTRIILTLPKSRGNSQYFSVHFLDRRSATSPQHGMFVSTPMPAGLASGEHANDRTAAVCTRGAHNTGIPCAVERKLPPFRATKNASESTFCVEAYRQASHTIFTTAIRNLHWIAQRGRADIAVDSRVE
jgi:hypothetical protein